MCPRRRRIKKPPQPSGDCTPKRPSTGTATNTPASGGRGLAFPLLQAYREQERSHLCAMARSQPYLGPLYFLQAFASPLQAFTLAFASCSISHEHRDYNPGFVFVGGGAGSGLCSPREHCSRHKALSSLCNLKTERQTVLKLPERKPTASKYSKSQEKREVSSPPATLTGVLARDVGGGKGARISGRTGYSGALGASESPPEQGVPVSTLEPKQQGGRA
uniref:Uncharacterized protein n=1 Tax=Myotis myotis TaxID=51298 RepID=A0A7J7Y006_MYOMY|nr:hypothetical protein mMyoMyo1_011343 [Myotis myotis]